MRPGDGLAVLVEHPDLERGLGGVGGGHRPTVCEYIKRGELASVTMGRNRRIRRVDLEAFIRVRRSYGWRSYDERRALRNDELPDGYRDADECGGDDIPL